MFDISQNRKDIKDMVKCCGTCSNVAYDNKYETYVCGDLMVGIDSKPCKEYHQNLISQEWWDKNKHTLDKRLVVG